MSQTTKLFINRGSQAVRLPAGYSFDTHSVFIRKNLVTGDVILSRRPVDWSSFVAATEKLQVAQDFLSDTERRQ